MKSIFMALLILSSAVVLSAPSLSGAAIEQVELYESAGLSQDKYTHVQTVSVSIGIVYNRDVFVLEYLAAEDSSLKNLDVPKTSASAVFGNEIQTLSKGRCYRRARDGLMRS